jgi:eukaryotic-like serine/threonine-protein kinase
VSGPLSDGAIARLREAVEAPDLSGTRYTLVRRLGRGGMGSVHLARDTALDRDVAVKVFDLDDTEGSFAARLAGEAKILARLEHPGIVPVHDVGRLPDGRVFYAMRYVEGRPLHREVESVRELPARLRLFVRVCEAVAFAHDRGVLHRDLKPENVMVGPFGEVLVMDWGVAHVLGETAGPEIVGTPGFMSPEQEAGSGAVDARSDVWSLGALLRFLLPDDAPKPLLSIVAKATAEKLEGRYAGALDVAAEVNRYLDGLRVEAHPEGWADRFGRLYARHKVAIWLVGTYLAVRVAMLVLLGR